MSRQVIRMRDGTLPVTTKRKANGRMAVGRPSTFTQEAADDICRRLALGHSLRSICRRRSDQASKDPGQTPYTFAQVMKWLDDFPSFASQYARARSVGLRLMEDELLAIADNAMQGVKTERKHVGWECAACGKRAQWSMAGRKWVHRGSPQTDLCAGNPDGKPVELFEEKTVTGDMIEARRLMVDTRKWILSKMRPDVYGDRPAAGGGGDVTVNVVYENRAPVASNPVVTYEAAPEPRKGIGK